VATRNLSRAGLKTVGAVAERPVALLASRFGADIALRLAAILGEADLRITPRRAPPAAHRASIDPGDTIIMTSLPGRNHFGTVGELGANLNTDSNSASCQAELLVLDLRGGVGVGVA
jgi:hypothetical protein